jgi:hypothetical protein
LATQALASIQALGAVDPAVTVPSGCGGPGEVPIPLSVQDSMPPYAGQLSLEITSTPTVRLTQVDPTTAAGHPAMATDPTGHRHAWVFTGDLTGVDVLDTRPSEPGWTIVAQTTDFTGPTLIGAADLGWAPQLVSSGSDAEGSILSGDTVLPALASAGSAGLSVTRTMATAGNGSGLGTEAVGAVLSWWVPDTTAPGTYTSTLTLTLTSP